MDNLFYPGKFEFRMGLERGKPADFFRSYPGDAALLVQRKKNIADHPERHSVLLPQGESLLAEFAQLLSVWGISAKPPTLGAGFA